MKKSLALAILLFAAGLVSACNNNVKNIEPFAVEGDINKSNTSEKFKAQQDLFKISLVREYNIIAERLALYKDYTSSTYFRRKARKSDSVLFDTLPEKPQNWRIKNDVSLNRLYTARSQLVTKLNNKKLRIAAPVSAAKAQAYYDCWVEQTQSGRMADFNCKDNFNKVNSYLNEVEDQLKAYEVQKNANAKFESTQNIDNRADNLKYEAKPAYVGSYSEEQKKLNDKKPASKAKASAKSSKGSTKAAANNNQAEEPITNPANFIVDESDESQPNIAYSVYFDKGSSTIKADSKVELDKAIADIKANNATRINVNGHTDTSANESQSLELSKQRADNVRAELIAAGISGSNIRSFGFGKSDSASVKDANVQNRVEITFRQKKTQ